MSHLLVVEGGSANAITRKEGGIGRTGGEWKEEVEEEDEVSESAERERDMEWA